MRFGLLLAVAAMLTLIGSLLAAMLLGRSGDAPPRAPTQPQRIVSLAPSITETLFALGVGDRVVGVTRFCQVPPEAAAKAKVGGLLDPNLEALVALQPDLVVMLRTGEDSQPALTELGINTLVVSHRGVDDIMESFPTIGKALGVEAKAAELVADLRRRLARVETRTADRGRPRVLLSVDRDWDRGTLEGLTVAASDGYFDRIIAIAGGENVCQGTAAPFPRISPEAILWMDPEVIIDVIRPAAGSQLDRRTIQGAWQQVADVKAVRDGRVYALGEDFASVPGPRFILLVEKLAGLLHPEVDWSE